MLDDLRQLVRDSFAVLRDYRFIYRELLALLADNPALRKRGMAGVEEAIRYFIATDMLRVPDANRAVPQLAQVCWIIAEFWLPFANLGPEPVGSAQMEQGADLLISALRPYLTEHALASGATRDGGRNAQENTDA